MNGFEGAAESSTELPALCAHDVLSNSDLFYVHFDERGGSFPRILPCARQRRGELLLCSHDVWDVHVRGLGCPGQKDIHVERAIHGTALAPSCGYSER